MISNIPNLNNVKGEEYLAASRASREILKESMLEDMESLRRDVLRSVYDYVEAKTLYAALGKDSPFIKLSKADLWSTIQQVHDIALISDADILWDWYCRLQDFIVYSKGCLEI